MVTASKLQLEAASCPDNCRHQRSHFLFLMYMYAQFWVNRRTKFFSPKTV